MMIAYYGGRWLLMQDIRRQSEQAEIVAQQLIQHLRQQQWKQQREEQEWQEAFEMHGDGNEQWDRQMELWAEEDLDQLQNKDL
jgi:hypothetical protein